MTRIALAAVLVLAALPAPGRAQELGRLFFSPAERSALDAQRREKGSRAAPAASPLLIDGYVMRSGGRATVWINGAVAAGPQPEGVGLTPSAGHPGELAVTGAAKRSGMRVKAGSTLDPVSGETRDVIGGGRLQVRR